jgi:hypothetical protein
MSCDQLPSEDLSFKPFKSHLICKFEYELLLVNQKCIFYFQSPIAIFGSSVENPCTIAYFRLFAPNFFATHTVPLERNQTRQFEPKRKGFGVR